MHWVVQNNMFSEEGFAKLLDALERLEVPYTLVKVVPFTHELVPEINLPAGPIMVMGTYTLCDIARQRGWVPGSFHNDLTFSYRYQEHFWPMLNHGSIYCNFADVPEQYEPFFIRPVGDTKSFIGQVMDWWQFSDWRDAVLALKPEEQIELSPDTRVMVNKVQEIWSETRVWIVDHKAVTASQYKFGTIKRYTAFVPAAITEFAEDLARKFSPARAFVMDVADTPDGLKVVEVNNLNCAGFYAGDMQKLVAAIEGMDSL